ncbi:MAG: DUF4272 domain-containing protein [Bacteroidota bacterium]
MNSQQELLKRKKIILNKLSGYGITDVDISYLPYLAFSEDSFQTSQDVGRRMLILWALSELAYEPENSSGVEAWLRKANLWDSVSEHEKTLIFGEKTKEVLINMSWGIEAVFVLAWALNLAEEIPNLNSDFREADFEGFINKFPIDEDPAVFLEGLNYRDKEEIFVENIVNELVTSHLRDLMLNGNETKPNFNATASFERHRVLNWVRKFSGISDWDETDTST